MDKDTQALVTAIHEIRREYDAALQGSRYADPQLAVVWADCLAKQFEGTIASAQDEFTKWVEKRGTLL